MKANILKIGLFAVLMIFNSSCQEEEFLKEVPLDFYSPENSYKSEANFQAALVDLLVGADAAPDLAARAATGKVAVVLDSRER